MLLRAPWIPLTFRATGAQRSRMGREVDVRRPFVHQVVESIATARGLQTMDAAEAAVVQHHEGELETHGDRGRDLRIHHEIAAVADEHDYIAVRIERASRPVRRRSRSPSRKSVFHVVAATFPHPARTCADLRANRPRHTLRSCSRSTDGLPHREPVHRWEVPSLHWRWRKAPRGPIPHAGALPLPSSLHEQNELSHRASRVPAACAPRRPAARVRRSSPRRGGTR